MVGTLILRGLLVGAVAGLLAFVWASFFGEPALDGGIAFEELLASHEVAEEGVVLDEGGTEVSRGTQKSIGLLAGMVLMYAGLGALFGLVYAFAHGRIGTARPSQTTMALAALGFITFFFVVWLKYPASPPASTDDDTVAYRTGLYFLLLAFSITAMLGALLLRQRFVPLYGSWNGTLAAVGAYVVVVGVILLVMPTVHEAPDGFPAQVMWDFRMAALGIQAVAWAALGLIFGYVMERMPLGARTGSMRPAATTR